MAEEDDVAKEAYGIAAGAGGVIAGAAGIAADVAAAPIALAAGAGVAIGMGLDYVTDGAITDTLSDGLLGLVGDKESLAAANDFDDGNYISGVGHMLSGAGDTISNAAGEAWDATTDFVSDAASDVADVAGEAWDAVTDIF